MSNLHIIWNQNDIRIWSNGEISITDDVDYYKYLDAEKTRELYEALRKYYRKSNSRIANEANTNNQLFREGKL